LKKGSKAREIVIRKPYAANAKFSGGSALNECLAGLLGVSFLPSVGEIGLVWRIVFSKMDSCNSGVRTLGVPRYFGGFALWELIGDVSCCTSVIATRGQGTPCRSRSRSCWGGRHPLPSRGCRTVASWASSSTFPSGLSAKASCRRELDCKTDRSSRDESRT